MKLIVLLLLQLVYLQPKIILIDEPELGTLSLCYSVTGSDDNESG